MDVDSRKERKTNLRAWGVLFATLLLPLQAAGAFLFQGCYAVFGRQLLGFWRFGVAPATGKAAVSTGMVLIPLGLAFAFLTFLGLRYALPEIRRDYSQARGESASGSQDEDTPLTDG